MELFPDFLQSGPLWIPDLVQEASFARANKGASLFDLHSETIKNSQEGSKKYLKMSNCWESNIFMQLSTLDHLGDKHQAPATPYIILCLKTRRSDQNPVSCSKSLTAAKMFFCTAQSVCKNNSW